jgi:hypothetical protein
MRWTVLLIASTATAIKLKLSETNSSCTPLPLPDILKDPALVGLEDGWVPYADPPIAVPGFCERFEIIVGKCCLS